MNDWMPIDTAPRDGSAMLLYVPEAVSATGYSEMPPSARHVVIGWHGFNCDDYPKEKPSWVCSYEDTQTFQGSEYTGSWTEYSWQTVSPTHWMPIPGAPQ